MSMLISNPFKELEGFFDHFKHMQSAKGISDWAPRVDITENKDAYAIRAELPGVAKQDVNVTLDNGVLTIKGEKHFEKEVNEGKTHRVECSYGQFVRSFSLPDTVDIDRVEASFKDGVLSLSIPKAAEAKTTRIEIKDE